MATIGSFHWYAQQHFFGSHQEHILHIIVGKLREVLSRIGTKYSGIGRVVQEYPFVGREVWVGIHAHQPVLELGINRHLRHDFSFLRSRIVHFQQALALTKQDLSAGQHHQFGWLVEVAHQHFALESIFFGNGL